MLKNFNILKKSWVDFPNYNYLLEFKENINSFYNNNFDYKNLKIIKSTLKNKLICVNKEEIIYFCLNLLNKNLELKFKKILLKIVHYSIFINIDYTIILDINNFIISNFNYYNDNYQTCKPFHTLVRLIILKMILNKDINNLKNIFNCIILNIFNLYDYIFVKYLLIIKKNWKIIWEIYDKNYLLDFINNLKIEMYIFALEIKELILNLEIKIKNN